MGINMYVHTLVCGFQVRQFTNLLYVTRVPMLLAHEWLVVYYIRVPREDDLPELAHREFSHVGTYLIVGRVHTCR